MIEERARVVAVEDGLALVETERRSACGQCAAGHGCGTALIGRLFATRVSRLRALNTAGASVGDTVVIGLNDSALVRAALAVYLAPLAGLLGGAVLLGVLVGSDSALAGEPAGIIGGLLGLVGGLAWARRFGARSAQDRRYRTVVLRRVSAPSVALTDVDLQRT